MNVVYDGVGKDTFDGSLSSLRIRGSLVLFGAASGPVPPLDPQRLNAGGSLTLTRPYAGPLPAATRRNAAGAPTEIFGAAADGSLNVRIGATYPLAEARPGPRGPGRPRAPRARYCWFPNDGPQPGSYVATL